MGGQQTHCWMIISASVMIASALYMGWITVQTVEYANNVLACDGTFMIGACYE